MHSLAPHSSTLLLFTTSGQTHIFPEIRIDAVRLLDLYLETFPDLVICGWRDGKNGHGRRVLDGYLSILNVSTKLGEEGDLSFTPALSIAGVVLSTAVRGLIFPHIFLLTTSSLSVKTRRLEVDVKVSTRRPEFCHFQ
jgi:pre-rRNA-processing protein IPI1